MLETWALLSSNEPSGIHAPRLTCCRYDFTWSTISSDAPKPQMNVCSGKYKPLAAVLFMYEWLRERNLDTAVVHECRDDKCVGGSYIWKTEEVAGRGEVILQGWHVFHLASFLSSCSYSLFVKVHLKPEVQRFNFSFKTTEINFVLWLINWTIFPNAPTL